ncbi:MAG: cytochrome c maturation protein CcmE [Alphaproteobacteria bacterium]
MRLRKQQRMILVAVAVLLLGGATALVMTALSDSVAFFATPSDIAKGKVDQGKNFRIGGLVVDGSVGRGDDGVVTFALTDQANDVKVSYQGILPDLFREGQGIVAQGRIDENGTFVATEVLAKHDENYMPAEVTESLKQAGMWNEGEGHSDGIVPEAEAKEAAQ